MKRSEICVLRPLYPRQARWNVSQRVFLGVLPCENWYKKNLNLCATRRVNRGGAGRGGSGGPDPPSLGQGHSRDMCKSEEFFQGGGTPLVKFGIADFTALFASLSVTFSDAVWRRHRTKVSAVC